MDTYSMNFTAANYNRFDTATGGAHELALLLAERPTLEFRFLRGEFRKAVCGGE